MDRGSQYTSKAFRQVLDNCNFAASYSKKGYPYDNAVAEAFMRYLKVEEVYRRHYRTKSAMELSLFTYIENYYNSERPHSVNDGLSPNQRELKFSHNQHSNLNLSPNVQPNTRIGGAKVP